MRISSVGAGYLGAVHATALASVGFDVTAVEREPDKVRSFNDGVPTFHEPGFAELLAETLATGRLRFTSEFADIADCDLHFLCVGTPQLPDGRADLSQVWGAMTELSAVVRPDAVIVGKSTVPVGTAGAIQERLLREGLEVPVLWNPEFLREGFAVRDTLEPDRIVVGSPGGEPGDRGVELLRQVYARPLSAGVPFVLTDVATAELVKLAANAFLATKISFVNAMAEICEATGADVADLASAIGHDSRIGSRFLKAGLGFGGGCLPKDIRAFRTNVEDLGLGESLAFLGEVDLINERCRDRAVEAACGLLGSDTGRRVTILGAAFKPDSDDIRDSPALHVASRLHATGAQVRVHDPAALDNVAKAYPHLHCERDVTTALADADLVMVLTEWPTYVTLDPVEAAAAVARPVVFDGRNCLPADRWRGAGWHYTGMGLGSAPAGLDLRTGTPADVSVAGEH